ncbi:rod shape-determining protein MreC [Faucicola atlantae]|uniref:rod shape-determining protein MreC n=1 Tax=Faucicola atlantae TaxID=34059 RepID=UPI0009F6ED7F|nr:rod shape-determining protein MreC [Moraxella atlantae]
MALTLFSQQPLALRGTVMAVFVAIVLMLLDSKNPEWFAPLRSLTHAAMQPIYQLSSYPSFVSSRMLNDTPTNPDVLRRENLQLRTELIHAKAQLQQLDYLTAENARLQGILSTTPVENYQLVLAQVIGTDSNPLRQMLVINKGSEEGAQIGQTVIDEDGILGQVTNVYAHTSRVLLISDEQQSVAVTVKRTGQRAIVSGRGNPQYLALDYIFKAADVRVGDELISSGLGERMPAGFAVGRVARVQSQQAGGYADVQVKPAANFVNTSYVLLLQPKTHPQAQASAMPTNPIPSNTVQLPNAVTSAPATGISQ